MKKQSTFAAPAPFATAPRPQIPLAEVNSKQVKAIGYDAATKELAVQFRRGAGAIYHYPGVEEQEHAEFLAAESIGRHFDAHFKARPFTKYPPEDQPETQAKEAA